MTVQDVDYQDLVKRMAEAGTNGMGEVLMNQLAQIGAPKTINEREYFWYALVNAARQTDIVWLWLVTRPEVQSVVPGEVTDFVHPEMTPVLKLPEVGGPYDKPIEKTEPIRRWPEEPTEENFRQQADALNQYLVDEGAKNPDNGCKTIAQYVASWYWSGTGRMAAGMQLASCGYNALATDQGLDWLRESYKPTDADD